jgi:hypothetical protein
MSVGVGDLLRVQNKSVRWGYVRYNPNSAIKVGHSLLGRAVTTRTGLAVLCMCLRVREFAWVLPTIRLGVLRNYGPLWIFYCLSAMHTRLVRERKKDDAPTKGHQEHR